jgi:predicted membrane protein
MSGALDGLGSAVHEAGRWAAGVAGEVGAAPWPVAAAVVLAGLGILLFGARPRRPVAALGAAGVAAAAAAALGAPLGEALGLTPSMLAVISAAVAGAVAALLPQVFPALAGALPGALLAGLFAPPGRRLEVLAVGAALGAVVGFLLARLVASAVAATVGALAVALGGTGALRPTAVGRALLDHPVAILAAAVILAVAGAAFQFPRAWGRGAAGPAAKREAPGGPSASAAEAS